MRRILVYLCSLLLLAACGGRTAQTPAQPSRRAFPEVEIPSMITEGEDRVAYMVMHQWDRFTDTSAVYLCDSVTVNGVALEDVEGQVGLFSTLLQNVSVPLAKEAVGRFYGKVETFGLRYPASNLFPKLSELINKYLYDPNSPVRCDDFYGVYAAHLAQSPLVGDEYKPKYRYEAELCARNPLGSVATDFPFTDIRGKVLTLHGIQAEYTLLIFGNPGCAACRELMENMEAFPRVTSAIEEGRLKVVDIFIDPEIDDWKAQAGTFPKTWICGYDHRLAIQDDRIYSVRGIPSLYLLDRDKKILLKDAPQEKVLDALANL